MKKNKLIKDINLMWTTMLSAPIFIVALFLLRFSPKFQFITVSAASGLYLITALIHHARDKTLTLEIVVEYVLIAALALILLQSLFF